MKEALAEILKDYPGVHCGLRRLEFEAPFSPFVHRWSELLEFRARKDLDKVTAEHIEPLYDVLYPDLTLESRRRIWENFLKGLDVQQEWKSEDLDDIAQVELNRRQIKNILKSAALLSTRKKDTLGRKYVDMVLAIEQRRPGVAERF